MAQRRMFSKNVARTDVFIDMPQSAQNLYFHLGIEADDDGFVSPKMVMRMLGSADDDLKLLIAKQFVIPFQDGVIVIRHWKVNNEIRQDRYKETQYVEHKKSLKLKDGVYDRTTGGRHLVVPEVVPMVDTGKDRLGKDRLEEKESLSLVSYEQKILEHWNSKDIITRKEMSRDAKNEVRLLMREEKKRDEILECVLKAIDVYATVLKGDEYMWSYKWNLYEFLKRGFKKFDGKTVEDYKKEKDTFNRGTKVADLK